MPDIPDCGIAFATLAAAERLLVLGEPVGALLVVSYIREKRKKKNQVSYIRTLEGAFCYHVSQNLGGKNK